MEEQKRLEEFDQNRGLLFSIAYRMLGSVADAEDVLQETFIRWLNARAEDIRSPKAFLITIITPIRYPPLLLLIPRRTRHLRPIRHPLPIQHPRPLLRRPSRTLA